MEKKTKPSFEEFEFFKSEKEKPLLRWIWIGNLFFLAITLIGQFVYQEILKVTLISWYHFWILLTANIFSFTFLSILWKKNIKIQF